MTIPSSLLPLAPSGRATGVGVATEVVVFMTSVVGSVKPAAVAATVVVIVSVVNVPRTSGTTRISEYKTAASKSKRCTDCKVTSEAESAVLTAGAVVAASVALTAGVATSLVLTAGAMVTEPAVGLAVAPAVAV